MNAAKICPVCAKPAVPDAPKGLCPECLLKSGFETRGPDQPAEGSQGFVPPPVAQIAQLFPQLEILELLGQGGMGAVYKARQPALGRFVALKILPPKSAGDPGFAERFNREARALARLSHPNIVTVYEFGQAGDMPYFLMEYVEGSTLRRVVQTAKLSPRVTLHIVMQICEALQFAHDEGVVHRDIKPENILVDPKGRVKIADFGIAKVLHQAPQDIALTGAKDVVGTAPYMAPEQLESPANVDHRADIFSLGVVFYELLTGELPLGKFQSPSQKVQIDVRLDEVVLHTLEKEPSRRYQQAKEVKSDVETIATTPANSDPSAQSAAPPVQSAVPPVAAAPPRVVAGSGGWRIAGVLGAIGLVLVIAFLCLAVLFSGWKPTWGGWTTGSLAQSNAFRALLNEDQRVVVQGTDARFSHLDEPRSFKGWSRRELAKLERQCIETVTGSKSGFKGPRPNEYYQAINTLAALRSTNALPLLRSIAFEHVGRMLRSDASNRRRWMATRALGAIGDRSAVPEMIHLLYHNYTYTRWWAQISLVRLTGQNFGNDWRAWGDWWNAQHTQPPFHPQMIRWYKSQPEGDQLAQSLLDQDKRFIAMMKTRTNTPQLSPEADEPDEKP
jgi:serine/threonine protein kinase